MKKLFSKRLLNILIVLVFTVLLAANVMAETYTATTMRLLHYEGSVEIEDSSGKSSLVMENIRFNSGDSLHTGAASSASVGLDSTKIVTLDENSRVQFSKQSNAIKMSLTEGSLFLDVEEKLDGDETLDIQTSTMTVGIRGTIVYVSDYTLEEYQSRHSQALDVPQSSGESAEQSSRRTDASLDALEEAVQQFPEAGADSRVSVLGVLEGTAQIQYQDLDGNRQSISLDAGKKATVLDVDGDGKTELQPVMDQLTSDDISDMILNQINNDPGLQRRIEEAGTDIIEIPDQQKGDDWTINSPVYIVAQSASKMFDGQPLTRTSDVLISGLPRGYTCTASAGGSQTDAGTGPNPVTRYVIYDSRHQDVTSHFTNINLQEGALTVDPAPLTVWTGSASKVYDGTPLTSRESGLIFSPGYEKRTISGRNLSYVITEKAAASSSGQSLQLPETQTLYGISGTVLVHGSNPLTQEIREFSLKVGEKLTVFLSDKDGENSIDYKVEPVPVEEIPEEILRIYQDNPELIEQACIDAGWDQTVLRQLIEELDDPRSDRKIVEEFGLNIDSTSSEQLMQDFTNVRITIDTEGTNYNNRALNHEEAHYTPMHIDPSIRVITTGSITDVGTVPNTYILDWGNANPSNYILNEEIGTLEVTPAPATVKTGSAEKVYDGTPLTNSEASISGLVNGETASVKATGSITNVGRRSNTYTIDWKTAKENNYSVSSHTGTLTVTENAGEITLKVTVPGKVYDGKPLIIDTVVTGGSSENTLSAQSLTAESSASQTPVTVEGLPSGFTLKAHITGSRTDAGTSELTIESYQILDEDGKDVTDQFSNVEIVESTLTIDPAPATVTTESKTKEYDGTALTGTVSISGLADADKDKVTVTATGSITDIGSTESTYSINWGAAKSSNYTLSENIGTLEVTVNNTEITFTSASAEKTYDGTPLFAHDVTAEGLPEGFTYVCTAGNTVAYVDAGTYANTFDDMSYSYIDDDGNEVAGWRYAMIRNSDGDDVTDHFTNIKFVEGTLTIQQLEVIFELNSYDYVYDGQKVLPDGIRATYGDGGEVEEESQSIEYDSSDNPYRLISTFNLIGGGKIRINCEGYTEPGTYDYEPTHTFLAGTEGNYKITYTNTGFTIEPLTLSIDLKSPTFDYDGRTHGSVPAVKFENGPEEGNSPIISTAISNEAGGFKGEYLLSDVVTMTVTTGGDGPDAGTYTLSCTYEFTGDSDPNHYKVNVTGDTLTINKITAVVTTGSATGPSGTMYPVTSDEASITGLADIDKEYVTIKATGSQNTTGSSDNTYSIQWGTSEHPVNSENYNIEEHLGTLTMFNAVTPEDPFGFSISSKALNLTETGSKADQSDKDSEHHVSADSKEDQSDQVSESKENKDTRTDQSDQESESKENKDTRADQPDEESESQESKDTRADQSEQSSESKESKDTGTDQGEQASESKEDTGKASDKSEEAETKKSDSNVTEKTKDRESVKSESADSKKTEEAETKKSDTSE